MGNGNEVSRRRRCIYGLFCGRRRGVFLRRETAHAGTQSRTSFFGQARPAHCRNRIENKLRRPGPADASSLHTPPASSGRAVCAMTLPSQPICRQQSAPRIEPVPTRQSSGLRAPLWCTLRAGRFLAILAVHAAKVAVSIGVSISRRTWQTEAAARHLWLTEEAHEIPYPPSVV